MHSEKLRELYAAMLKCRALRERVRPQSKQQRSAMSYPAVIGQEAAEVGCTLDLRAQDIIIVADHRGLSSNAIEDVPLGAGLVRGMRAGTAAGTDLGCGVTLASKMKQAGNVVVAFSSGGCNSGSAWRRALRSAAARSLPIVFVSILEDGRPAEEGGIKPRRKARGANSPAGEYSFPTIPVDCRDVVAIYRVAHEAIRHARLGSGPTLIECKLYRLDRGGQTENAASDWGREDDPIERMEQYLIRRGFFSRAWKNRVVWKFSRDLEGCGAAAGWPHSAGPGN